MLKNQCLLILTVVCAVSLGACKNSRTNKPSSASKPKANKGVPVDGDPDASLGKAAGSEVSAAEASVDLEIDTSETTTEMERSAKPESNFDEGGTWTTRRLIALVESGPQVIDLSVSVAGKSLREANQAATDAIADQLLPEDGSEMMWSDLLELPLVRSGWLGNLVAEDDQIEQLVSMYDTERDEKVTRDELAPFLTRGLSRRSPMQISDAGSSPQADVNTSPWGSCDLNNDYSLDRAEADQIPNSVERYDYNGDSSISASEVGQANSMTMTDRSMNSSMMLAASTILILNAGGETDADVVARDAKRTAQKLLKHFTFLSDIERSQWPAWSDSRWNSIDKDASDSIDKFELQAVSKVAPDVQLFVRFPGTAENDGTVELHAKFPNDKDRQSWQGRELGGALRIHGITEKVIVTDAFSGSEKTLLRERLEAALGNAQLKSFFVDRLQLSDDAFDLVDADGDMTLSDEEFDQTWRWLCSRQGARLVTRWMLDADPWFHILDVDGDSKVGEVERNEFGRQFSVLDSNADGVITPNELPMVVRLEVNRNDQRFSVGLPAGASDPTEALVPEDWFAAMDTNQDGVVSRSEFLGDREDFEGLDSDKDGFVARGEVDNPRNR